MRLRTFTENLERIRWFKRLALENQIYDLAADLRTVERRYFLVESAADWRMRYRSWVICEKKEQFFDSVKFENDLKRVIFKSKEYQLIRTYNLEKLFED